MRRRMGTCSCLQHGGADSAISKSSSARRFILMLAMCTTMLVSLAATPVSAARRSGLQKDLVIPLRGNMQKMEMEEGSMTFAPARKLILTEQQEVTLKPIDLVDESNHVETYRMAEGRELVAQTDDYTAPCANNKHDKTLCRHG